MHYIFIPLKGFYDRFIGRCRELNEATTTIGIQCDSLLYYLVYVCVCGLALGYSAQICDDIPTGEHDRTIDIILSP